MNEKQLITFNLVVTAVSTGIIGLMIHAVLTIF